MHAVAHGIRSPWNRKPTKTLSSHVHRILKRTNHYELLAFSFLTNQLIEFPSHIIIPFLLHSNPLYNLIYILLFFPFHLNNVVVVAVELLIYLCILKIWIFIVPGKYKTIVKCAGKNTCLHFPRIHHLDASAIATEILTSIHHIVRACYTYYLYMYTVYEWTGTGLTDDHEKINTFYWYTYSYIC